MEERARSIVTAVRERGDAAVLEYTQRFNRVSAQSLGELEIPKAELNAALKSLPAAQREALTAAAARVREFHEKQSIKTNTYIDSAGNELGQQVTPLDRAGIYVPGGKAAYPSTVIMNATPAKVAGVREIIMVVPTPNGEKNAMVLAAAALCGVDRVFAIGGAQVSEKHTNFLINTGAATSADIEALGEEVRRRVLEQSGVQLQWEIRRLGVPK